MTSKASFVIGFVLGGVVAAGTIHALRDEGAKGARSADLAVVTSNSASTKSAPVAVESDPRARWTAAARAPLEQSEPSSARDTDQDAQPGSGKGRSSHGGPEEQGRRTSPTNLVEPVPVPEELRPVLEEVPGPDEEITMKKAHRLVSGQKKDDQWAWQLEQNFLEFFANHPLGSTIDLWLVECRTSFCEIQLASYGDGAKDRVGTLVQDMQSDPRISGYTSQWASTSENNGILYFAIILNWGSLDP